MSERLMKRVHIAEINISDFITDGYNKQHILDYFNKFDEDVLFEIYSSYDGYSIQAYKRVPETDKEYKERMYAKTRAEEDKRKKLNKLAAECGATVIYKDGDK